jgi:hypothetical protein
MINAVDKQWVLTEKAQMAKEGQGEAELFK